MPSKMSERAESAGDRDRKMAEAAFHDALRTDELQRDPERYRRLTANRRFYAVTRGSTAYFERQLFARCPGRRVLDYGCGNGQYALLAARQGALATGIDISDVSIANARQEAARAGVSDRVTFHVMDCEAMEFEDDSFDVICVSGVLHHLDLGAAMREIARVLRPGGEVICAEALGHNPLIRLYRRMTPHLRTAWETDHIIRRRDVLLARRWFRSIQMRFFHLATLAVVPLRTRPVFDRALQVAEAVDEVLLRIPGLRWQAWQIVYVLSDPIKPSPA
jgi:SAM-dependent methyltransferase